VKRSQLFLAALAFAAIAFALLAAAHILEAELVGAAGAYYEAHPDHRTARVDSGWTFLWLGLLHFVIGLTFSILYLLARNALERVTWRAGAGLGLIVWAGFAAPFCLVVALFVAVPDAAVWATILGWAVGFPTGGGAAGAVLEGGADPSIGGDA
jgi:hypothetical protein